jgi:hypothetical protein
MTSEETQPRAKGTTPKVVKTAQSRAKKTTPEPEVVKTTPEPEVVKTTLRVPRALWDRVQHRAIKEGLSLQDIAERAFGMYLKGGQR